MSIRLCLTPGDPEGIGPEITARFLSESLWRYPDCQYHVLGDLRALEQAAIALGLDLPQSAQVSYGNTSGSNIGQTVYNALDAAVIQIATGQADALVTGPIAKFRLEEAGIQASGHTEILEALSREYFPQSPASAQMIFVHQSLRLLLLTRHIALRDVSQALAMQDNASVLNVLIDFLHQYAGVTTPHLALLGLNPHAGELNGTEERDVLMPLIQALNASGRANVSGPHPADAFFRGFQAHSPGCDAIVATYHDQGLIPFKLLAGYQAVNVTIGLPFLRTSVSHGTAFDIAGLGLATPQSLVAAVDFARQSLLVQAPNTLTTV